MSSWLVIDTETTGLLQPWSFVVEFAAVWVQDGKGISAFTSMVNPPVLDERANAGLAVNHIDPKQLLHAPSPEEVRAAFADWSRRLPADTQTAAYNAPFDRQHCERLGLPLPAWGPCIMQRARKHFGVQSIKLVDAAASFRIPPYTPAHRALSDAYTAAAVLVALDAVAPLKPLAAPAPSAWSVPAARSSLAQRRPSAEVVAELHALQHDPREPRAPIARFENEHHYLSNFYLAPVQIYGWTFPSVEHAYQAMKSSNPAKEWPYFLGGSPGAAKKLGQSIQLRTDWEQVKFAIMSALVYDKFMRHPDLAQKLRETVDAPLIEGNGWGDVYWGVCNGVGENKLGQILVSVREELFKLRPF